MDIANCPKKLCGQSAVHGSSGHQVLLPSVRLRNPARGQRQGVVVASAGVFGGGVPPIGAPSEPSFGFASSTTNVAGCAGASAFGPSGSFFAGFNVSPRRSVIGPLNTFV